jgi:hypothetical protein
VPAQSSIWGFESIQQAKFLILVVLRKRGRVLMQDTELVVTVTLCFASGGFHISTKNSSPASAGTSVFLCVQSINSYFFSLFFKEDYNVCVQMSQKHRTKKYALGMCAIAAVESNPGCDSGPGALPAI